MMLLVPSVRTIIAAVAAIAGGSRPLGPSAPVVAAAVLVSVVALWPVPTSWDDGCNTQAGIVPLSALPYIALVSPDTWILVYGARTSTLVDCEVDIPALRDG